MIIAAIIAGTLAALVLLAVAIATAADYAQHCATRAADDPDKELMPHGWTPPGGTP